MRTGIFAFFRSIEEFEAWLDANLPRVGGFYIRSADSYSYPHKRDIKVPEIMVFVGGNRYAIHYAGYTPQDILSLPDVEEYKEVNVDAEELREKEMEEVMKMREEGCNEVEGWLSLLACYEHEKLGDEENIQIDLQFEKKKIAPFLNYAKIDKEVKFAVLCLCERRYPVLFIDEDFNVSQPVPFAELLSEK